MAKQDVSVIGPTGGTGQSLVEQALEAGHTVRALARRPEAVVPRGERLRVVKADVFDRKSLAAAFEGTDAVVFCAGVASLWQARKPTTIYSEGIANTIAAMRERGVRRLVVVSSGGVEAQESDPWFFTYLLKPLFLKGMYADMRLMEDAVRESSDLDWTIVRPPYLTKGPLTRKYRVSPDRNFKDDKDLSRHDLAHFLLQLVEAGAREAEEAYGRRMVAVSY